METTVSFSRVGRGQATVVSVNGMVFTKVKCQVVIDLIFSSVVDGPMAQYSPVRTSNGYPMIENESNVLVGLIKSSHGCTY